MYADLCHHFKHHQRVEQPLPVILRGETLSADFRHYITSFGSKFGTSAAVEEASRRGAIYRSLVLIFDTNCLSLIVLYFTHSTLHVYEIHISSFGGKICIKPLLPRWGSRLNWAAIGKGRFRQIQRSTLRNWDSDGEAKFRVFFTQLCLIWHHILKN